MEIVFTFRVNYLKNVKYDIYNKKILDVKIIRITKSRQYHKIYEFAYECHSNFLYV